MEKSPKTGLQGLLRQEDSIVVLINHQPYQFTNLYSHEATILTTAFEERGGYRTFNTLGGSNKI